MTPTSTMRIADRRRDRLPHLVLATAIVWLRACAERRRQRLALLELSDALLKDIGVSRADAFREGSTPSWRR